MQDTEGPPLTTLASGRGCSLPCRKPPQTQSCQAGVIQKTILKTLARAPLLTSIYCVIGFLFSAGVASGAPGALRLRWRWAGRFSHSGADCVEAREPRGADRGCWSSASKETGHSLWVASEISSRGVGGLLAGSFVRSVEARGPHKCRGTDESAFSIAAELPAQGALRDTQACED